MIATAGEDASQLVRAARVVLPLDGHQMGYRVVARDMMAGMCHVARRASR
jgi:hypothetical protein